MQPNSPRLSLNPLLIALGLLILLAVFIQSQLNSIAVVPATASANVFSAQRAFNQLQHLTQEQQPHPVDSAANRIVEQRLVGLLQQMGYQPEVQQSHTCQDTTRGLARCALVRNIIVHIEGQKVAAKQPNNGILLSAHYDSVPAGPGGSDAGAAVGTLLEIARLLTLTDKPLNPIVLLFNEGEEFGLLGAKAFMQHPLAKTLQLAINVEARGSAGKSVMFETGEDSGWLVKSYQQTTPAPFSSSLFYEVYKFLPNDTDLTVFKNHGLQGLNFAHAQQVSHYHTPMDNLANLDRGSLQHHGDNVWGIVQQIKDINLSEQPKGNLIYTDILGLFMIHWDQSTSLWFSLLLLIALGLVSYLLKQQVTAKQVFTGILTTLVILLLSALAAYLVQKTSQILSGNNTPWHTDKLPMQIGLWLSVLISGLMAGKWLSAKSSPLALTLGLVTFWSVSSLSSSLTLPGISFLFIIPATIGIIGLFVLAWVNQSNLTATQKSLSAHSTFIKIALVTAITFMPIAYILAIMLGYHAAVVIGVILGFIVSALLPLMVISDDSAAKFKQLIYATSFAMFAAIGLTASQPAFSDWQPQHLNLHYLQDTQADGFILAGHQRNKIPSSLSAELTKLTQRKPELKAMLPWGSWRFHTVPAQAALYQPAQLTVLTEPQPEMGKQVSVKLSASPAKGQQTLASVKLYIPVDSGLKSIQTGDNTLSYANEKSGRNSHYEFRCRGRSCAEMTLTFNFTIKEAVKLLVISQLSGLPQVYQSLSTQRGGDAVPVQNGDQSMIITEFIL